MAYHIRRVSVNSLLFVVVLRAFQPSPAMLRPLFEQELERRRQEFGKSDSRTAQAARDLGVFLKTHGDPIAARDALTEAVRIDEAAFGLSAPQTLADIGELESVSPPDRAERLWRRAAASPDAGRAAQAFASLAQLPANAGDPAGAADYGRQALAREEAATGRESLAVAARLTALARMV